MTLSIAPAVDTAIQTQDQIIDLRERAEASMIEMGRLLADFVSRDLHESLGHKTVNEWLDSRPMGIGRALGHELMNTWATYGGIDPQKLARAGHEKLRIVAPQIGVHTEVPDPQTAVEYAIEFSKRELQRMFKAGK